MGMSFFGLRVLLGGRRYRVKANVREENRGCARRNTVPSVVPVPVRRWDKRMPVCPRQVRMMDEEVPANQKKNSHDAQLYSDDDGVYGRLSSLMPITRTVVTTRTPTIASRLKTPVA